ncbi:MAG: hypothetical protein WEB62_03725 [Bacteroidota bacterium]
MNAIDRKQLAIIMISTFVAGTGLSACSGEKPRRAEFKDLAGLYKYDKNASFNIRVASSEPRGNVFIRDIVFTAAAGRDDVGAFLVSPSGNGLNAAILWVHWLGEEKSDRTQFLDEAIDLASRGVVSLLVNAMWADSGWYDKRIPEQDYSNSIRQVVALRRAMDLLLSQPDVDSSRVAVVGHDYGGMYATIMGGVDQRAKTYVFIAVTPSLNDWAYFGTQPKSMVEYVRQNAVFEIPMYLRETRNASVLFQFGKQDFYVSGAGATIYFRSANEPKKRMLYDADHGMRKAEIQADRKEWLIRELNLR